MKLGVGLQLSIVPVIGTWPFCRRDEINFLLLNCWQLEDGRVSP